MEELRAARPDHLAADGPVDPRTRHAELAHAFAQPRQAPRRSRKPLVWSVGLAAAAAAVTAVAVVGVPETVQQRPPAAATTAAATELSARDILLVAATNAEREPADSGEFWYVSNKWRTLFKTNEGFVISLGGESETWVGAKEQHFTMRDLGPTPATDADRALWEQAGSPREVSFSGQKRITMREGASKPHTGKSNDKEIFWLGRNVTMADLQALPSDPEALKADLLRFYTGQATESNAPSTEDGWLFQVAEGLITTMPVSPEVRAGAFRMLAGLPSVTSLGQVTDAAGRTGTAIAIEGESQSTPGDAKKGVVQIQLIIDEKSGRALGRQSVVVVAGGAQRGLAPGTVWNAMTILESGWTDERPS
ncbi:CU044_5270 family protein [Nonomuraea sp. NPDC050663]|uniref:CU044_5270 family protein n=1 Tax=Nonomuraea sp. NPDC050663 TaxID=3364370 RepID=UPI0037BCFC4A